MMKFAIYDLRLKQMEQYNNEKMQSKIVNSMRQ